MKAVIGAGFGDEGKGMVVGSLYGGLVVRYSGGQQAGHTTIEYGERHIHSSFGSKHRQYIPTYISKLCTVYPSYLMNEYEIFGKMKDAGKLYIHPDTPITTPYDIQANRSCNDTLEHGTCGMGVGKTYRREEAGYKLHYSDLFYPTVLQRKVEMIRQYYNGNDSFYVREDYPNFFIACDRLLSISHPSTDMVDLFGQNAIFEGSQGLMLDPDIGYFPHVTSSYTGMKGISKIADFTPDDDVYYVTRCYGTRHGNGPFNYEKLLEINDPTNQPNQYQGSLKTGDLDGQQLKYAIDKDRIHHNAQTHLVITCVDQLDEYIVHYGSTIATHEDYQSLCRQLKNYIGVDKVYYSDSPENGIVEIT